MTGSPASRPRLAEVAALAGVSSGTVSNVLNRPQTVSTPTRKRVEQAIDTLSYTRNDVASALARGDTRTLGLIVIGLSNSLFVDLARGAQRAARGAERYLQLGTAEDDEGLLRDHMSVMTRSSVSGLLVAPMTDISDELDRARRAGCPVVLLNHDPDRRDCCRVLVDNERVGVLAAEHLVRLGRRRIAVVGGDDRLQPVARRRAGVRAVLSDAGLPLEELDATTLQPASGVEVARRIAARPPELRPDAIIAVSDLLAMAMISEFRTLGLTVPGDVAVLGCDHNSAAWGGAVPLTSVSMEGETMGEEGVRLLLRELADGREGHAHTTVVLEPRLLIRESTVGRAASGA